MEPIYLHAATLVLTVVGTIVGTTWRVSNLFHRYDTTILKMMAEHELADTKRFAEVRAAIVDMGDNVQRSTGEMGNAIRQKIHEFELWSRDNFLTKKTFEVVQNEHGLAMQNLARKVETNFKS